MFTLKLEHSFSAAHQLKHAYSKECNEYKHGHNWKVLVEINTEELINSMVVDFKKIKEIINFLDHRDLNTILNFEPTAENLAKYLHDLIKNEIKQKSRVNLTIWEAEKASISYEE